MKIPSFGSISLVAILATACNEPYNVTVFAAASLEPVMTAVGAAFEAETGETIRFNFAGSQQLVAQVRLGAVADVLLTADSLLMKEALDDGLVADPIVTFAFGQLILVASTRSDVHEISDLSRDGVSVSLGVSGAPVGRYARELLRRLEQEPSLGVTEERVLANVVSLEENVTAVLARVAMHEVDAGVVYASDARRIDAARVRLIPISELYNVRATYPAGRVVGGDLAGASAFLDFLLSLEAQSILAQFGFTPVNGEG